MKERPILFSSVMVRAILDGRKTQTRRVVKFLPRYGDAPYLGIGSYRDGKGRTQFAQTVSVEHPDAYAACPYGAVGDRLCPVHYGIIGDKERNNHNGNTNEGRDFAQGHPSFTKRRLHGGGGRSDLLPDEVQRLRQEGTDGLVSTTGTRDDEGLSVGQSLSREQEGDEECTSNDLHGISRNATETLDADAAQGRESAEQRTGQSVLGNSGRKLGGSTGSRNGLSGREASDVETDGRGTGPHPLGHLEGAVQPAPRSESARDVTGRDSGRCSCSDHLWVKESFYAYGLWVRQGNRWAFDDRTHQTGRAYLYVATDPEPTLVDQRGNIGWHRRPSIFMPRWASRITLNITGVRVERLQDISTEDVTAEGVQNEPYDVNYPFIWRDVIPVPVANFHYLWDKINGKKYPWASNPWVWVVEFQKL